MHVSLWGRQDNKPAHIVTPIRWLSSAAGLPPASSLPEPAKGYPTGYTGAQVQTPAGKHRVAEGVSASACIQFTCCISR